MYLHPGDDRPSPGNFHELQEIMRDLELTPANLIAIILDSESIDPFNGPRAMIMDGLAGDGTLWGEIVFGTIAFRDKDFLIQILHAVGIHQHIDPDLNQVLAQSGPAAGEPDKPSPIPPKPEPVIEPPPEDDTQGTLPLDQGGEVIVAETP